MDYEQTTQDRARTLLQALDPQLRDGLRQVLSGQGPLQIPLTEAVRRVVRRVEFPLIVELVGDDPDTLGAILLALHPDERASNLMSLDPGNRPEVVRSMASMTMESWLRAVASTAAKLCPDDEQVSGLHAAAETLNSMGQARMNEILDTLRQTDSDMASNIRSLMFVFEDIQYITDQGLQRLLRAIEPDQLALALKAASDTVKNKLYSNLPPRVAEDVKSRIQESGPVRLTQVEEVQRDIVALARRLEEDGEIVIVMPDARARGMSENQ